VGFLGMILIVVAGWYGGLANGTFNWHFVPAFTAVLLIPLLFSVRFFFKPATHLSGQ
jgi:hypothetical protein